MDESNLGLSGRSQVRLHQCHPDLVRVFTEVSKHYPISILEGHRPEQAQNEAFDSGKTKVRWPNSKHNSTPSRAIDAAPYPVDWSDRERFSHFAGFVMGVATMMGVKIRWGGDWDLDTDLKDNTFDDLPHFELIP